MSEAEVEALAAGCVLTDDGWKQPHVAELIEHSKKEKEVANDTRRFRKAYVEIPRKNGKSRLVADVVVPPHYEVKVLGSPVGDRARRVVERMIECAETESRIVLTVSELEDLADVVGISEESPVRPGKTKVRARLAAQMYLLSLAGR